MSFFPLFCICRRRKSEGEETREKDKGRKKKVRESLALAGCRSLAGSRSLQERKEAVGEEEEEKKRKGKKKTALFLLLLFFKHFFSFFLLATPYPSQALVSLWEAREKLGVKSRASSKRAWAHA